jgi:tRNA nucleotidyltransferase/poly(A) polymerase
MSSSFIYKDIRISFNGDYAPMEVKIALKNKNVPETALSLDVYNRDFTINMLAYDINTDKIIDLSGLALEDIKNKRIRTLLDPNYVCQLNPIIILRALKLKIRYGYNIDGELQGAMMENADSLFDGRYLETDLIIARENVKREGKKEAEELFDTFRLDLLEKIK